MLQNFVIYWSCCDTAEPRQLILMIVIVKLESLIESDKIVQLSSILLQRTAKTEVCLFWIPLKGLWNTLISTRYDFLQFLALVFNIVQLYLFRTSCHSESEMRKKNRICAKKISLSNSSKHSSLRVILTTEITS